MLSGKYNTICGKVQAGFFEKQVDISSTWIIFSNIMSVPESKFLNWHLPLAETAAAELRKRGRGTFPVDFSQLWIVVQTAEAGRLLREKLAGKCADAGGAVNLRITLPERLLAAGETAGTEQVLAAWLKTLRTAKNRDFPELFRNGVLSRFNDSDEILLGWGEALHNARMTLALDGFSLDDAAAKLDDLCRRCASENKEIRFTRFSEFSALEKLYLDELDGICRGCADPAAARLAAAEHPQLPRGVERIILIDCADLPGAPEKFLGNSGAAVECWINAPEEYREHFDGFGRPDPGFWTAFPIDLDPAERLRIVPRPNRQAKKIVELLKNSPHLPSAVAVLDPEVAAALETYSGSNADIDFFIPRETPLALLPWSRLLLAILRSATDGLVADAAAVWGDPIFADYARDVLEVADLEATLRELDKLRDWNLAAETDFLRGLVKGRRGIGYEGLDKLIRDREKWSAEIRTAKNPVTQAYLTLSKIGEACRLKHLDMRRSEDELDLLKAVVAALDKLDLSASAAVALLRRMLATTRSRFRDESPDAIDVVGFLELPWRSDSPVLIAGFNDGFLSAGARDDLFLPEQARIELGMRSGEELRAADALRFAALLKRTGGEVYVLMGSCSQSGDRLFPARLLLQCGTSFDKADELARRTELLFGERSELIEEPDPPTSAPPMMRMNVPELPTLTMSITGFSAYLACPFNFLLNRILRAEHCDVDAAELSNTRLGTLVHGVLQECGKMTMRDAGSLERELAALLDAEVAREFGSPPPGLIGLQREMIRESLHYFAEAQYAEHQAGWRIVKDAAEYELSVGWDDFYRRIFPAAPAEGWRARVTLNAKIDRIDVRTREDGVVEARVLDYKTNADGKTPQDAHFGSGEAGVDDYRAVRGADRDGKKSKVFYWQDLQLPLYVLLVRHFLAGGELLPGVTEIGAGYFNLPTALTETGVRMFDELASTETLESAAECADRVLHRIFVEKEFWPPAEKDFECFPSAKISGACFVDPEPPKNPEENP